jgi:hypothetical protein
MKKIITTSAGLVFFLFATKPVVAADNYQLLREQSKKLDG